jgi:hypothetical protein
MSKSNRVAVGPELTFDGQGNAVPPRRGGRPRQPGSNAISADPVLELGYVRLRQTGRTLVVEFAPAVASPLAVAAAFYEISDRAPRRLVLACRGNPDRFETFRSLPSAFRRIEALSVKPPRSR